MCKVGGSRLLLNHCVGLLANGSRVVFVRRVMPRDTKLQDYLHRSQPNDATHDHFSAFLHLEILDDEDRENSKGPVRKRV